MKGVSHHEASSNDAGIRRKGNTRQDQEERQPPPADDTSTHASLAAMSTDDVSSMGETYHTGTTGGSRRKRKDDCGESRCTVTSEESARSRSRRRRCRSLMPDQQRWLDRIDRRAATSDAPIRPNRSDDDSFLLPPPTAAASSSNPAPRSGSGTESGSFCFQRNVRAEFFHSFSTLPSSHTRMRVNSYSEVGPRDLDARDVARCQSMKLPPVRPTRTRDDSKTDLMNDDSRADTPMKDDSKATIVSGHTSSETSDKNEIDSDMFARLLSGQAPVPPSLTPPSLAAARSCGAQTVAASNPPVRPRRQSDADAYKDGKRRHNTAASTWDHIALSSSRACPHKCQSWRRDKCSHAISPKPPAKPFRSLDDAVLGGAAHIPTNLEPPLPPLLPQTPRVSDGTATLGDPKTPGGVSKHNHQDVLQMSSSNRMDLEQAGDKVIGVSRGAEQEDDVAEVQETSKEYDPDLFERLLNGESCSTKAIVTSNEFRDRDVSEAQSINTNEAQTPPPLSARVSNSSGNAESPALPGYNRFDNSAPCAMPEHMEGAMKSSHPPMRPRRSFDEGMAVRSDAAMSLANAAAVACVAGASNVPTALMAEPGKRRICIIGGKRRYCRPWRRATLDLASELPPSSEHETTGTALPNTGADDPTQEANFVAPAPLCESSFDLSFGEINEEDEYVQRADPMAASNTNDGSYQRILPARRHRRMVRRFTMPSKGGAEMTTSPQSKKRRTIGRSLSCRDSSQDGMTPAAA